jgi:phage shock protein A
MLRLLNYSKYQIEGRPKKGGVKKRKMTKSEIKKFYPDLYEAMQEMEDPELKQLEKDIREMEKEMLELMYE